MIQQLHQIGVLVPLPVLLLEGVHGNRWLGAAQIQLHPVKIAGEIRQMAFLDGVVALFDSGSHGGRHHLMGMGIALKLFRGLAGEYLRRQPIIGADGDKDHGAGGGLHREGAVLPVGVVMGGAGAALLQNDRILLAPSVSRRHEPVPVVGGVGAQPELQRPRLGGGEPQRPYPIGIGAEGLPGVGDPVLLIGDGGDAGVQAQRPLIAAGLLDGVGKIDVQLGKILQTAAPVPFDVF